MPPALAKSHPDYVATHKGRPFVGCLSFPAMPALGAAWRKPQRHAIRLCFDKEPAGSDDLTSGILRVADWNARFTVVGTVDVSCTSGPTARWCPAHTNLTLLGRMSVCAQPKRTL